MIPILEASVNIRNKDPQDRLTCDSIESIGSCSDIQMVSFELFDEKSLRDRII